MASQSDALRIMLAGDAWDHQPQAFGHCTNCRHLIIGWSAYQWSILEIRPETPNLPKPLISERRLSL